MCALVQACTNKAPEQPFRFVALGDDDQKLLVRAIKNLRKQGFGDNIE